MNLQLFLECKELEQHKHTDLIPERRVQTSSTLDLPALICTGLVFVVVVVAGRVFSFALSLPSYDKMR